MNMKQVPSIPGFMETSLSAVFMRRPDATGGIPRKYEAGKGGGSLRY